MIKKILQFDWMKGTTGHTQQQKMSQMLPFVYDYLHAEKLKILIEILQRYC